MWPYDCGPTDILRRVQVGMSGEPTRDTEEVRLSTTIGTLTMPAVATSLAGEGWVHQHHAHTSQLRLVGDEGTQLCKCPAVQHSPLASNRSLRVDALPYPFEIFEGDAARGDSSSRRAL